MLLVVIKKEGKTRTVSFKVAQIIGSNPLNAESLDIDLRRFNFNIDNYNIQN